MFTQFFQDYKVPSSILFFSTTTVLAIFGVPVEFLSSFDIAFAITFLSILLGLADPVKLYIRNILLKLVNYSYPQSITENNKKTMYGKNGDRILGLIISRIYFIIGAIMLIIILLYSSFSIGNIKYSPVASEDSIFEDISKIAKIPLVFSAIAFVIWVILYLINNSIQEKSSNSNDKSSETGLFTFFSELREAKMGKISWTIILAIIVILNILNLCLNIDFYQILLIFVLLLFILYLLHSLISITKIRVRLIRFVSIFEAYQAPNTEGLEWMSDVSVRNRIRENNSYKYRKDKISSIEYYLERNNPSEIVNIINNLIVLPANTLVSEVFAPLMGSKYSRLGMATEEKREKIISNLNLIIEFGDKKILDLFPLSEQEKDDGKEISGDAEEVIKFKDKILELYYIQPGIKSTRFQEIMEKFDEFLEKLATRKIAKNNAVEEFEHAMKEFDTITNLKLKQE